MLKPYIDLLALGEGEPEIADVDEAAAVLRATYRESVRLRVDTDLPVGVILSGGLDSSLTLLHAVQLHPDCRAFTVGTEGSEDVAYARRLARDLGVPHEVVMVRPGDISLRDVRDAIYRSEVTEYGDAINAVVSMKIFERVHECGVKVVLTGDGSDELFGGYDMYAQVPPEDRRRLFLHKIRHLSRTELQRVDRTSMGMRVEARVPFLDIQMLLLSMRIPLETEGARRLREVDRAGGFLRPAAGLHQSPPQESDVALERAARADPALQAALSQDLPVFWLRRPGPHAPRFLGSARPARQRPEPCRRRCRARRGLPAQRAATRLRRRGAVERPRRPRYGTRPLRP